MRLGALVPSVDRRVGGARRAADVLADIRRAERLGYESAWLSDHLFVERDGTRTAGHDPLALFAAAAVQTERIRLGTLVLGDPFRPVWQTAREATALADLSGGRFILGMGAGWHQPEFDAFAIPFDHLVSRLEERVPAIRQLVTGRSTSSRGRYVELRDAVVVSTAPPPPIWIAGKGPRMLRLTARCADGWNLAWGGPDPSWAAEPLERLRAELDAAGRDPASFTTSIGVTIAPGTTDEQIRELAGAYERTGIDLLVVWAVSRPGGEPFDEGLERVASTVGSSGSART